MKLFCMLSAFVCVFSACQKTATVAPDNIFSGKLPGSGAVNFYGLCSWNVEYINTAFDVKLDNSNQKVLYANIATTMKEKLLAGNCIPAAQQSQHAYTLSAYAINGNSVVIYFKQDDSSFPQNNASFSGTITATGITGILIFYRKADAIFCKVEMPFQITKNG
jgi:hypothetical protein